MVGVSAPLRTGYHAAHKVPCAGVAAVDADIRVDAGHIDKAEDIAAAALYLASSGARYVTGQVLTVDGGMVM